MVRRKNDSVRVSRGARNVLADLGVENAADLTTKVQLAVAINRQIAERGLSQVQAAWHQSAQGIGTAQLQG
jgi:predicted XRE-type DNA-binding protein